MKNLYACFLILAALCLFHPSVKAQVVLEPSMDTYVQQTNTNPATTNADTILRVRKSATGGTVTRNVYLRYDISNVTGILSKAELAMTVEVAANNAAPPVLDRADVHEVDDSWDPATLIYDNQPTAGAVVVALEGVSPIAAAVWPKPVYKVEVTSYVQSKLSSSASVISFMLSDDNNTGADLRFYSSRCLRTSGQLPIQLILTGVGFMPVEMTSFTATMSGTSALLKWNTATEVNNIGFEVERRSTNSEQVTVSSWEKIAFIAGAGTSTSPREYSYQDANLAPGVYVYRIKQIDNNGAYKYSATTQVDAGVAKGFELLSNYPNPFNPETNIRFSVPENGFATLKVFNMLGQEVATLFSGMAQAGHYIPVTFDGSHFASGVYFSRLRYNGKSLMQRMLMTK